MKSLLPLTIVLLFTVAAAAQPGAQAIQVTTPWSRALPPVSQNGAAYVTLMNSGHHADKLVGASSPVAQRAELHTHTMEGGIMKMRPLTSVELPPGKEVEFKPGGLHVMLIGLKQPLKQGDRFPLTLRFANTPPITVEVVVQAADARGSGMQHEHAEGHAHEHHAITGAKGEHAHDQQMSMPTAQAPTLALTVEDGNAGGLILMLDTTRFRFAKEHVDSAHVAGEGHAHLYIDGKKIGRIYAPRYELKPLTPGVHEIEVGLYTNNHMAYAADGKPVSERFVVLVSKSYQRSKDNQLQRFSLAIEHGKVNVKDETIRIRQGDVVELHWSSDRNLTLHLHGYDIEADVRPGSPVVMRFVAFATGRFPVEIHGSSHGGAHNQAALLYLEVRPR
jgi:copper(I)-binding protein